jgi:hypothetical protein
MQTQAIVKQMEEAERRRNFNSSTNRPILPTVGYGAYSNSPPNRFSWLWTSGIGGFGLFCWILYMFWTLFNGANFTGMDLIAGLVFFIWYGGEY